jgi:hypothetical protein
MVRIDIPHPRGIELDDMISMRHERYHAGYRFCFDKALHPRWNLRRNLTPVLGVRRRRSLSEAAGNCRKSDRKDNRTYTISPN